MFIDRIMSLGASYCTWVDRSDITRVFSDCLEFSIDYSVPLSGSITGLLGVIYSDPSGTNHAARLY